MLPESLWLANAWLQPRDPSCVVHQVRGDLYESCTGLGRLVSHPAHAGFHHVLGPLRVFT